MRALLAAAVLVACTVPAGSLGDRTGSRVGRQAGGREAAGSGSTSGLGGRPLPCRGGGGWLRAGDASRDPGQARTATLLSGGLPRGLQREGAPGRGSDAWRRAGEGCLVLRGGQQYQQAATKKEIDGTDTICPWNPEPLRLLGDDINRDPEWYPEADMPDIRYTGGEDGSQDESESIAPCIPRDQLPYEYVQNTDQHAHLDEPDICMWCDPVWKKNVKLLTASREGDYEAVLSSIDQGADVRARDKMYMNWTALHYASYYGHATIVESLADFGASIDAQDVMLWTPLHYAAFKGRHDSCLALLNCGANVSAETEKGKDPLQKAVYLQHVDCIELLCEWMGLEPQDHIFATNMTDENKEEVLDLDAQENDRLFEKLRREGEELEISRDADASEEEEGRPKRNRMMDLSEQGDSEFDGVAADGPKRTAAQEANHQEILAEYDRRYRLIKNRDRAD